MEYDNQHVCHSTSTADIDIVAATRPCTLAPLSAATRGVLRRVNWVEDGEWSNTHLHGRTPFPRASVVIRVGERHL